MTQSLPRLYVSSSLAQGQTIDLDKSQTHYIANVLRMVAGTSLLVFDGINGEWRAEIASIKRNSISVQIVEQIQQQISHQDLHYLFAPLKHARLDYLIQKAVEMGVSSIRPVLTAHTIASRLNIDRMKANAIEAAEQCGILAMPQIEQPIKLSALLDHWDADRIIIYCDEKANRTSPIHCLQHIKTDKLALLIGPEGGFSIDERKRLLSQTFVQPISLGPRVMRADTAAVAALALLNAVLGDWRT